MTHWLLDSIEASRTEALKIAQKAFVHQDANIDYSFMQRVAEELELATLDLIREQHKEGKKRTSLIRHAASDAFTIYRILPQKDRPLEEGIRLLRLSSLALLGDMSSGLARFLREIDWPQLPTDSANWQERTWAVIIDVWLQLICKDDCNDVLKKIAQLRHKQNELEGKYFEGKDSSSTKAAALELIGLYHLAKASEILAQSIADGVRDEDQQIHQLLEFHFNQIFAVCDIVQLLELEILTHLLSASIAQIIEVHVEKILV